LDNYKDDNIRFFSKMNEIDKALHTLEGIVKGIAIDGIINDKEIKELKYWYEHNKETVGKFFNTEISPYFNNILKNEKINEEDKEDLLYICQNYKTESKYYDVITSDIQRLEGIFHGILADNIITDEEIYQLDKWIMDNEHLKSTYPYDELESLILDILKDGKITPEEKNILKVFFSEFISSKEAHCLNEEEINTLKKEFSNQIERIKKIQLKVQSLNKISGLNVI